MNLEPIRTEAEYEALMDWIDQQFDEKPSPDSPDGKTLQIALLLINAYEDAHFPNGL